jgi:hypothetical protein
LAIDCFGFSVLSLGGKFISALEKGGGGVGWLGGSAGGTQEYCENDEA